MLLFIILLPVFINAVFYSGVSGQTINFEGVPKKIYDNIDIILVIGNGSSYYPKAIKLEHGLTLADQPTFKKDKMTEIYLPGWGGLQGLYFADGIISAFMQNSEERNVVTFNYSSIVKTDLPLGYVTSVYNTRYIGRAIGQFLKQFCPNKQVKELIHFIGHSLGAQIMSHVARTFGVGLLSLTGLDPAWPGFYSNHLSATDGCFLDVYHTNAYEMGDPRQIGSVDFYPNGGVNQQGCMADPPCNHRRAWQFYAESILNKNAFLAKKCKYIFPIMLSLSSCNNSETVYMGYGVSKSARGKYYLKTAPTAPYGLGDKGIDF